MGSQTIPLVTLPVVLLQRICIGKALSGLPRHPCVHVCLVVLAVGVVLPATLDFELVAPEVPVS
eukprot:12936120-Prorocentrum_lima.AAC.1